MENNITIKDIAEKAGVSLTTVSLVLNNKKSGIRISKKTRDKILKIAKELNYTPNILAKGLKSGKSSLIGVIFGEIMREVEAKTFEGIEDFLTEHNYGVIVRTTKSLYKNLIEAINFLINKKVEGIISTCAVDKKMEEILKKRKIKLVEIRDPIDGINTPFVSYDNLKVGYIATKHLIELGHKEIICLTPVSYTISTGLLRMEGYKKAIREADLEERIENFEVKKGYYEAGYRAIKDIIERGIKFTGIFVHCDMAAVGVLKGLKEYGLKVPEDVSIVSVDNESFSEYLVPSLTTVNIDNYKLGWIAGEIIYRLLKGEKLRENLLEPELIIRDSTRPLICSLKI